jgi:methylenetetrahydrofolate dehydrogenase (NADP+)/methenyltetrahydrofolate cyclohydrolase
MSKISGLSIAQHILSQLRSSPTPTKSLVALVVGNNQSTLSFIKQKKIAAENLGIKFQTSTSKLEVSTENLKEELQRLSSNQSVGGIIVQLPLPTHLNIQEILDQIPQAKDTDVLSTTSIRLFEAGERKLLPPAVGATQEILTSQNYELKNKVIAVVGLGRLVGQPIAYWLKDKVGQLVTIDLKDDLDQIRDADLVVSGAGHHRLINPEKLKKGAAVIDFGYEKINGIVSGDLNTSNEHQLTKLSFYTPTPSGTGPILVAKLLENFYLLNQNKRDEKVSNTKT